MAWTNDLESRIRQYAQSYRRSASPGEDLHARVMSNLTVEQPRRMSLVSQLSLAAAVVMIGLVTAFGAWQLRNLKQSGPVTPSISPSVVPSVSASPTPSASASASASPTPSATARQAGAPMQLLDLSFADASYGWAIGSICPQQNNCPLQLRGTTDGGHSWFALTPPAVQALGGRVSWRVYFENASDGWIYGDRLYATHDGGATWTDVRIGHQTLTLAPNGSSVWAMEADCSQSSCVNDTLFTSNDSGRSWARSAAQPYTAGSRAQLVRVGASSGWLLTWMQTSTQAGAKSSGLAVTHDGGYSWQTLVTPCAPQTSLEDRADALTDGTLWIVCGGDHAMGQERKQVIVSHDGGLHWNFPPDMPLRGFVGSLALSGDNKAWFASPNGPLYKTSNDGATWQTAEANGVPFDINRPGSAGKVVFLDSQTGWAAYDHDVYWTKDGGAHWGHTSI